MNTTSVLQFMDRTWVQTQVLLAHDRAREGYTLEKVAVADPSEFKRELGRYVRYHLWAAQGAEVSEERAFGIAVQTLNASFPRRLLPDGYSAEPVYGATKSFGPGKHAVPGLAAFRLVKP